MGDNSGSQVGSPALSPSTTSITGPETTPLTVSCNASVVCWGSLATLNGLDHTFVVSDTSQTETWTPAVAQFSVTEALWFIQDDPNSTAITVNSWDSNSPPSDNQLTWSFTDQAMTFPLGVVNHQGDFFSRDMYINLTWEGADQAGTIMTPVFQVLGFQNETAVDQMTAELQQDPIKASGEQEVFSSLATATPTATPGPSLGPSLSSSSSQAHSGLNKGAIAGIAVAAGVVGLALIGLLLWFFLFRRRAQPDHVKDQFAVNGRTGTNDYMMEKETHANVTESLHSPYSDDGLRDPIRDQTVVPAPPGLTQDRGFSPYTDGPVHETPLPVQTQHDTRDGARSAMGQGVSDTRDGARSAMGQGVSASVAHLVEDGMTQDQIWRLEEEERALDEAIEQAGRR